MKPEGCGDALLANLDALPVGSVVYFLMQGDLLLYVGRTANLERRLGEHTGRLFTEVYYLPCAIEDAAALEQEHIRRLQPKHNIAGLSRKQVKQRHRQEMAARWMAYSALRREKKTVSFDEVTERAAV